MSARAARQEHHRDAPAWLRWFRTHEREKLRVENPIVLRAADRADEAGNESRPEFFGLFVGELHGAGALQRLAFAESCAPVQEAA